MFYFRNGLNEWGATSHECCFNQKHKLPKVNTRQQEITMLIRIFGFDFPS